jgi:hypothetical protein
MDSKKEKRDDPLVPFFYEFRLLLNDGLGRALGSAGAALQALAGVDLIVQIAHLDRFGRTLCCAGTAGQALVGDNKSHDDTSVFSLSRLASKPL